MSLVRGASAAQRSTLQLSSNCPILQVGLLRADLVACGSARWRCTRLLVSNLQCSLIPFNINPHYYDPQPGWRHMGESRRDRIKEFQACNCIDVLAMREGAILRVEGKHAELEGQAGAIAFLATKTGTKEKQIRPGESVDFML